MLINISGMPATCVTGEDSMIMVREYMGRAAGSGCKPINQVERFSANKYSYYFVNGIMGRLVKCNLLVGIHSISLFITQFGFFCSR